MKSTLLIPLDNRPCTSRFPREVAAIAGFDVLIPPVESLGNLRQPAHLPALENWLEVHAPSARWLVLSLDTWLYGGLVFSRQVTTPDSELAQRLEQLVQIKVRFPHLRLALFGTLLRLSNHNDATEERPYWAQYGEQMHRLSWLEHKQIEAPEPVLAAELEQLKAIIPAEIVADYRQLRQRNFKLLLQCLDFTASDVFEAFYIGCDDSAQYGWNVLEKNQLAAYISALKSNRTQVQLYPGADEIASVLIMKCLLPETQVCPVFSFPDRALDTTLYEGLPLQTSLEAQARAAGITLTPEAPLRLWVHNPPTPQTDQYLDRHTRQPISEQHYQQIIQTLTASAIPTLVADVCYANGGDQGLLELLESSDYLAELAGYSAWNTAGNTLGFALAWAKALAHVSKPVFSFRLLLERLLDDGWYQGMLRQRLCTHYSEPVTLDSSLRLLAFAKDRLQSWQSWVEKRTEGCRADVRSLNFPWRRFFEIELSVCLKKPADTPPEDHLPFVSD